MTKVCDAGWREVKAGRGRSAAWLRKGWIYWMGRERGFGLFYVLENRNVDGLRTDRGRIVGAWVCLLAAVFLYAPLAAATWSAHAMACCTGDYCPIAAHHHRQNAPAPQHSHMDCEHDAGEMMNCSMSCCPSSEKPLVTAVAFVLPHMASVIAPASVVSAVGNLQVVAIPQSAEPLSPPPRLLRTY